MAPTHDGTNVRQQQALQLARERQWQYLGPIMAAPFAHICVTLYRSAKTPQQKQLLIGGIVGSSVLAVGMRLALMVHAGYPGGQVTGREVLVTAQQKRQLENPSTFEIIKGAFKGFG
uniref:Uncharacterized protein n=1 Tax=Craspedostauros australis TaxID=1486917 RepID=A0A6T6GJW9_9STRA|mmetsp:Transcript_23589/g.65877  ORF Transcript_23589/g.65877 Transcript_23589/m.65877 type:complete len:117 (+) Transcript_23589:71-421(+)